MPALSSPLLSLSNHIALGMSDCAGSTLFPELSLPIIVEFIGQLIAFAFSSPKLQISKFKFSDPSVQNMTILGGKAQCHFPPNFHNYVV